MIINGKKIKAKDAAEFAEVSRSTVIKYYGISREDYLKEASKKRSLSFQLRSSGLKWKEVAQKMNTTQHSAIGYYRRYLASHKTE